MSDRYNMTMTETIYHKYGRVFDVKYEYDENRDGAGKHFTINWPREDYDRMAFKLRKPAMSYDNFIKVLHTFMMGEHALDDIPEAFRLLDTDRSGTIDITKLHEFVCVMLPRVHPYFLLHQIQKADKDGDYRLNYNEFKSYIRQGFGRDVPLGIF